MLPDVIINLLNGQIGGVNLILDRTAGLLGTGVTVAGTGMITVGSPVLLTSLDDATAIGITTDDNPAAYRQVKEFYSEAPQGSLLFFMLCPDTMPQADMWDITNANGIKKLLDYAQGTIRFAGSYFKAPTGYVLDVSAGIDADVFDAISAGHALCETYFDGHQGLRGIVEGRGFSGVAADLTDLKTMSYNRMAVVLGGSAADKSCSVGLALGRLAAIPPQRKISRVKGGPLTPTTMYIGTADAAGNSTATIAHDKGYIVPRTFPNKVGYYWSGDHTCTKDSDDYCFLSRGRVIDKAAVIAYQTYTDELDDDIEINPDGTLPIGWIKNMEQVIKQQVNGSMAGEISGFTPYINPVQNVTSTNETEIVMSIQPKGYNSRIKVSLGYINPANA